MSQDEKLLLQDKIKEQGEVVRKLKASKAPKDQVNIGHAALQKHGHGVLYFLSILFIDSGIIN